MCIRDSPDTSGVDVIESVTNGELVLSGIVTDQAERERCVDVAGKVAGVTTVTNQLGVIAGSLGGRIFPGGLTR